jgi:hypothetical protein
MNIYKTILWYRDVNVCKVFIVHNSLTARFSEPSVRNGQLVTVGVVLFISRSDELQWTRIRGSRCVRLYDIRLISLVWVRRKKVLV